MTTNDNQRPATASPKRESHYWSTKLKEVACAILFVLVIVMFVLDNKPGLFICITGLVAMCMLFLTDTLIGDRSDS